ncbi:BRCA2-interacting transcriptional repressor EMSY isoform X1 [Pogonomyrmex barbatus]|uniref:BRCA2-interacting transcriptional repressor EMSY isoform X1 n=1 Tax=Pogonomyrmex barbatus TaxID=144034 RepID=A0A6I9VNQ8_9HYME|nr:BRCA2-interacting transcriptional repressor EMSY isoform X1 [Pogonomyrmex barbatus]
MWPMRPEMTRDECRKCLRYLELDAYGSMVSVLRAQGPFTSEKQKLLQELAKVLHISNERHRAEVRRAVNDEKLATIAEQLNGPNTGTDWTLEGRRTIPLLPRLKARSAFTALANSLSLTTAIANEKLDRCNTISQSGNLTAAETESHSKMKMEENLSTDAKLNSFENEFNDLSRTLQENSNLTENERIDNKDVVGKINEKKFSLKRKSPSPLPTAPPNKVLIVSESPNHTLWTSENKQASEVLQVTKHQNFALITVTGNEILDSNENTAVSEHLNECTVVPLNKPIVATTTSVYTSNANNPKTVVSTEQKISTKVVPEISNDVSDNTNKLHSTSKEMQNSTYSIQKIQVSDDISSNLSCVKSSVTPIIQNTNVSSSRLTQSVPVYPGTTVSSGPGPPQVKQVPIALMCKKLPSEQIVNFDHQSTAKTVNGIFPKKVVNMPHYTNTKLNKTNVIVIQKAKAVTLSHAGKEVLGKVIMGGKNLCVTSQHNANSINVQPHHISLNNGDQIKTILPTANSPQNIESVKTNIKSGKAAVVSVVTRLRHDVPENKVLSQLFDSPAIVNIEPKTVIQDANARLPNEECNSDKNTIDRESSLKVDSAITSIVEEKQHKTKNDIVASMNSQINLLDPKSPGSKEILVRPKQLQDNIEGNIRVEKSDEDANILNTKTFELTKNLQNFQYLMNNDENCDLEKSSRSLVTVNQIDEHGDS